MLDVLQGPRVSVGIINWNYGRFITDAIRSVRAQTYADFECVVLDNGSSDNSLDVIRAATADDARFRVIELPENIGHLGAGLRLLDQLAGEFVTFLDADDVLAPDYLAVHLQAHLTMGYPVGISSSNLVSIDAEGHIEAGSTAVMPWRWPVATPCDRTAIATGLMPQIARATDRRLEEIVRYLPNTVDRWSWSPGSSNMYRRSQLHRVRPSGTPAKLFGGIDGYFASLLHALTGSLLINAPLSLYRVHGNNTFAVGPACCGVQPWKAPTVTRAHNLNLLALRFLVADIERALVSIPQEDYWRTLDVVTSVARTRPFVRDPAARAMLAENLHKLVAVFGRRAVIAELRNRLTLRETLEVLARSESGLRLLDALITLGPSRSNLRRLVRLFG